MISETSPEYEGLRQLWIDGLTEAGEQQEVGANGVRGAFMEIGFPRSVVTLVTSTGGDVSLYYQTGGGLLGGFGHAPVREAAHQFILIADQCITRCQPTTDYFLPATGEVRFIIFTRRGVFAALDAEQQIERREHPLFPLFYAGHEVITQLRLVMQKSREQPE